jgi:predicted amidohydrolase YtcJ
MNPYSSVRRTGCAVALMALSLPAIAADILFVNGRIHTMDTERTVAETVLVEGNRIVCVGPATECGARISVDTTTVDLHNGVLLPGFTDAHVHPIGGGTGLLELSFSDQDDAAAIQTKLLSYANENPNLEVIYGSGWSLKQFQNGNPHKSVLDAVVSDRAVVLVDSNHHSVWGNSRALELAGIDSEESDPVNGRIERSDSNGEPSGTLRESAQTLLLDLLPEATVRQQLEALAAGLAYENAFGYTAVIDAMVRGKQEEIYAAAAGEHTLTARTLLSLAPNALAADREMTVDDIPPAIEELIRRRTKVENASGDVVRAGMVKIMLDGGLESCTAAFLKPYADHGCGREHRGTLNIREDVLQEYVASLDKEQFQVHIHAIGDRTTHVSLNALENAGRQNDTEDRRHTISHLQFVHPDDALRFQKQGVFANLQMLWAFPYDTSMDPFSASEISRSLYPFRSLRDAGATLVAGSDWPVSTANPFYAMEVAVLRKNQNDSAGRTLIPTQAIDVDDVLAALTINGARQMHQEADRGSIETGKLADLVVADTDPYVVDPHDLSEIIINMTVFDGVIVYQRDAFGHQDR